MAREKAQQTLAEQYGQKATPITGGGETYKWDEEGKELVGLFLGLSDGSMGGKLARIQTEHGVETCSAPKVLADALASVPMRSKVHIRYLGEEPNQKGQNYKNFEAVVVR